MYIVYIYLYDSYRWPNGWTEWAEPGGGHNSPNFAWLGLNCTVNFVEKCFLMTELVS